MKELKALESLKEYIESEDVLGVLDYAHYTVMIDYINIVIQGLEELNNRSCRSCKYSFDIFTGIDNNLLGEDFICTKLEVDKVFEKDFYCNRYEAKGE